MKLTAKEIEEILRKEWLKKYQLVSDPDLLISMSDKIIEAENGKTNIEE